MVIDEEVGFMQPGSGKVGVLAYSGPQSIGYWKDPEKTAETHVQVEGHTWVKVGDMCTVDDDGIIDLIGRSHSCINSGGEKIYPYEVENLLLSHDAVRDVMVIGLPHRRWGEAVTVVVELAKGGRGGDDLREKLNEFSHLELSDYKCPKHYIFFESLERSYSGKVLHRALRKKAIQILRITVEGDEMLHRSLRRWPSPCLLDLLHHLLRLGEVYIPYGEHASPGGHLHDRPLADAGTGPGDCYGLAAEIHLVPPFSRLYCQDMDCHGGLPRHKGRNTGACSRPARRTR
ncbi:MAG: AMP-binding protein [Actinomycetota bacterium]|nr:AMP-binding protein [Actinomycetota bacterium]